MVRRKENVSTDKKSKELQSDDKTSALDCLAEVCLIYRSKKGEKTHSEACPAFTGENAPLKNQLVWSNSRTQERASSTILKNPFEKILTKENPSIAPSLFLSVHTEIKKGKNVNMNYMRSDRLWTLCLRLEGAQHLKRLGFRELKVQGDFFYLTKNIRFLYVFLSFAFFVVVFLFFL